VKLPTVKQEPTHIWACPKCLSIGERITRGQCDLGKYQIDIATACIDKEQPTEWQRLAEAQANIIHETLHLTESNVVEMLWAAPWMVGILTLAAGLMLWSARLFKHWPERIRIVPGAIASFVCFIGLLRPMYLLNPNEKRARKPVVPVTPFMKKGRWQ